MIINHDKKYLFIHVPRTGGTSLKDALILQDNGKEFVKPHGQAQEAKAMLKDKWDSYFKFAFVRNPHDWILSLYHHIINTPLHVHYETVRGMTFNDYIEWRWKFDRRGQWWHLSDDYGGKLIIDRVYKYENYDDNIRELNAILKTNLKPGRKNSSSHKPWEKVYNMNMIKRIENTFGKDFEWFKYGKVSKNLQRRFL